MKKLCIIPFTKKEYPIINYLGKSYCIRALVSPKGIGIEGEDIAILRNSSPTGNRFENSIAKGIEESDVVMITQVYKKQELYEYAMNALRFAATSGKEIICFLELTDDEKEAVLRLCEKNGTECVFLDKPNDISIEYSDTLRLNLFEVPVFYIGEVIPDCDGYDVFLKLADSLQKNGKNVLAISEDCYNPLMGFEFMKFSENLEVRDQIFRLNCLAYEMIRKSRPEVILIKLPLPLMRYNEANPFDCGVTAFLISQAITGTGCIICSNIKSFTGSLWEEINDSIQYKFGCPIIGVHMSNQLIDITGGAELSTIRTPYKEVEHDIEILNKTASFPFYQLLEDPSMDSFNKLLAKEYFNQPYGVI